MEWFRIVLREKAREQLDDPGDMEKSIKTGKLSGATRELTGLRLYCCPFWITIDNFLQRIKSFVIYNRPDDNLLQRIKSLVIYNSSDVVVYSSKEIRDKKLETVFLWMVTDFFSSIFFLSFFFQKLNNLIWVYNAKILTWILFVLFSVILLSNIQLNLMDNIRKGLQWNK